MLAHNWGWKIIEITREIVLAFGIIALLWLCLKSVKLVKKQQAIVLERFGTLRRVLMPGIRFIWPFLEYPAFSISLAERKYILAEQEFFLVDESTFKVKMELTYLIENVDAYLSSKCMPEPQLEKHLLAICNEYLSHCNQMIVQTEINVLVARILPKLQDNVLILGLRIRRLQIFPSQLIASAISSKHTEVNSGVETINELESWSSAWLLAKIKDERKELLRIARERTKQACR